MGLSWEHILLSLSFHLCPRTLKHITLRSKWVFHLLFSPGGSLGLGLVCVPCPDLSRLASNGQDTYPVSSSTQSRGQVVALESHSNDSLVMGEEPGHQPH